MSDKFIVIAIVVADAPQDAAPVGCLVVPEDSVYPAIYYQAYGPASKKSCEDWKDSNCVDREIAVELK